MSETIVWRKRGHIFSPSGQAGWMLSHSQGPTPLLLEGRMRIFFSSRPQQNCSLPTFIDVNPEEPRQILSVNDNPILDLGEPGTFDEHGIIPKQVIRKDGRYLLYYIGWSRRTETPYSLAIGVAESSDATQFHRCFRGPVLGLEKDDALSTTAPGLIEESGLLHMFYTAGLTWIRLNNRYEHTYTIRRATSRNGLEWKRDFKNVLEPRDELECLSNPTILKLGSSFHMWYSYKGSKDFRTGSDSYRIGYASAPNLTGPWTRNDSKAGIDVSKEGWDSDMIEYPYVLTTGGKNLLFYNGNNFGGSGFGYAEGDR